MSISAARSKPEASPHQIYLDLMATIRRRLDITVHLAILPGDDFSRGEAGAFHGRKVIEGIAFGCLVAIENGLKLVPKDAKGQWNAENIFEALQKKKIETLPSPSVVRAPTDAERQTTGAGVVVEGIPERRLTHGELITIYQRTHRWLHELNPYTSSGHDNFYSHHGQQLWDDLSKINRFIERHQIGIAGEAYFCTLRDSQDGATKVIGLSKIASTVPWA